VACSNVLYHSNLWVYPFVFEDAIHGSTDDVTKASKFIRIHFWILCSIWLIISYAAINCCNIPGEETWKPKNPPWSDTSRGFETKISIISTDGDGEINMARSTNFPLAPNDKCRCPSVDRSCMIAMCMRAQSRTSTRCKLMLGSNGMRPSAMS
jgi:hypothetical protein